MSAAEALGIAPANDRNLSFSERFGSVESCFWLVSKVPVGLRCLMWRLFLLRVIDSSFGMPGRRERGKRQRGTRRGFETSVGPHAEEFCASPNSMAVDFRLRFPRTHSAPKTARIEFCVKNFQQLLIVGSGAWKQLAQPGGAA